MVRTGSATPITTDERALSAVEQQRITDEVTGIIERRSVIDQAKGMLMLVYGIDADAAFKLMRAQSQDHNVKVVVIAEQNSNDLQELARTTRPFRGVPMDRVLLDAHERIARATDPERRET